MKILVSGASGMVGTALRASLTRDGHEVRRLVRRPPETSDPASVFWDPDGGVLDAEALAGCDAVVHLGGESIAAGRWTRARKDRILTSRTRTTRLLAETMAAMETVSMETVPSTLITASAIGWYGDRGDEILTEDATPGQGFLADVCLRWEGAAEAARNLPASDKSVRHVALRIGMVLSPRGGALGQMLTPFRLGLGGVLGSGRQWVSWISVDDLVGVIRHALEADRLSGPINSVAPHPVTMREFTKTLGRVLKRPTVIPVPSFLARLAFGEMADELLLASTRVDSRRLVESGYEFRHPELEGALRELLG